MNNNKKRKTLHNEQSTTNAIEQSNNEIVENEEKITETVASMHNDVVSNKRIFDFELHKKNKKNNSNKSVYLMVLPMSRRKRHTYEFDHSEKNRYYRELTMNNCNEYYAIKESYGKFDYICNIVARLIVSNFVIIKYDEESGAYVHVDNDKLYDIVNTRLRNLRKQKIDHVNSISLKKHVKECKVLATKETLTTNQNKKTLQLKSTSKQSKSRMEEIEEYPPMSNVLDSYQHKSDILSEEFVKRCKYFSVLHSLKSGFSFYVYNYSHYLTNKARLVHECTKTKLIFPPNPPMFIVFHARLVHSGAESKFQSYNSTSQSHDARTFSYIELLSNNEKEGSATRTSRRNRNEEYSRENGIVDRSLHTCDNNTVACQFCNKYTKSYDSRLFREIDLYQEYIVRLSTNANLKKNGIISGDLYKFGWEVRLGVNIRNPQKYSLLNTEICTMIYARPNNSWKGIDDKPRKYFPLMKEIEEKENANIKNERDFPQTFQLFKEIESMMNSNTSKKSTNNRTFVFHAYSILVNSGILFEQLPHRDYPSKV